MTQIEESKAAGYEMVGTSGLSCITCHQFNGQPPGRSAHWTSRTRRSGSKKLVHALHAPTLSLSSDDHHAGFWPDGKIAAPQCAQSDTGQQIEAIWTYLADGERARKPVGLSRQSSELRVG